MIKKAQELKSLLHTIDHRGYPAYKETKGLYQFDGYRLSIDHVQGDPFASPSKVSIHISGQHAGFPKRLWENECQRIAVSDMVLRVFSRKVSEVSYKAKGSGKSGLMAATRPGQEVLERTACQINPEDGGLIVRMEIGFPAFGRSINSGELIRILFDMLPDCVNAALFYKAYSQHPEKLENAAKLAEDQCYLRAHLAENGLVAFVADGAILPRESGVSSRPMKNAIPFVSPESMRVSFNLPNYGEISGMGIRKGITLIVGGGYHGKSTLLKALEQGIYDHIAGDGREFVVTDETAVKLRAEDGRCVHTTDISLFIKNLPNGKDTTSFSTEDASGSTSQAANVVEAILCGSRLFLIDEDTSATNFMIRDELMQSVVHQDMEPIIPYIDRIRSLYEKLGISTILVAGSSGSYFVKADHVIQMNRYEPVEITRIAKQKAELFLGKDKQQDPPFTAIKPSWTVAADTKFAANPKNKIKSTGKDGILVNHDLIDLRYVEQIIDTEQVNTLAQIIRYAKCSVFDGRKTVMEAVDEIDDLIRRKGFGVIVKGDIPGNLAVVRKQEIAAMFNRYRQLSSR